MAGRRPDTETLLASGRRLLEYYDYGQMYFPERLTYVICHAILEVDGDTVVRVTNAGSSCRFDPTKQ
jgi:hypothetical protein